MGISEAQALPAEVYVERGAHVRPFLQLDFGTIGAVLPTHYTLLNGGGVGCRMLAWVLEGGYCEEGPWHELHKGSLDVFHGQPHGCAHFQIAHTENVPYRFVRLSQLANTTTNASMYIA